MSRLHEITKSSILVYRLMLSIQACAALLLASSFTPFGDWITPGEAVSASIVLIVATVVALIHTRRLIHRRLHDGDVAEAKRLALLQMDPMTGALSRRVFMEELRVAMKPATLEEPCALFLIDVDHFKMLNDSYGHNVGDFALTHLVDIARRSFPGSTVGRLGGDEFAVLLCGYDQRRCLELATDFLHSLRVPTFAAKRQLNLSASVGLAIAPNDTSFHEEMILLADLALYESKRQGRGRATLFDPDMLRSQRHRRTIERELRAAILLDHLELHYQKIVDPSGNVASVEALVRWQHPTRGTIAPNEFIPVAEETSLIDMLGEWVIRRACMDFAALPGQFVSVNVSAAQLKRDDMVDMVKRVLRETGLRPRELVLEITENVALAATPAVLGRIQALRNEGIRVSLDDFGTGHCGFNYLRNLPVDIIKIDRSYVSRIGEDPVSRIFVTAVVETARALNLTVVAEGIETEQELILTKAAGCGLFQGFLLHRPCPCRLLDVQQGSHATAGAQPRNGRGLA